MVTITVLKEKIVLGKTSCLIQNNEHFDMNFNKILESAIPLFYVHIYGNRVRQLNFDTSQPFKPQW